MTAADEAYDRLHGLDGHTQATPREEPCPACGGSMRFCECMDDPFAPVPTEPENVREAFALGAAWALGDDDEAPAALRAQVERLSTERDRYRRAWKSAATRAGIAADCAASAEAEVERLRDVLAQVHWAFNLQCPPMPVEKYASRGAWVAHSWWNTVLGGILNRGGVGTGAGEGATGQDTGTAWVTRSEDCPEAPAQAHPLGPDGFTRLAGGAAYDRLHGLDGHTQAVTPGRIPPAYHEHDAAGCLECDCNAAPWSSTRHTAPCTCVLRCDHCGHRHTPEGCAGPPTPSDRWAGVSPSVCDCPGPLKGLEDAKAPADRLRESVARLEGRAGVEAPTAISERVHVNREALAALLRRVDPQGFLSGDLGVAWDADGRLVTPCYTSAALELSRQVEQEQRRAEAAEAEVERLKDLEDANREAEYHITQLAASRDQAERRAEAVEALGDAVLAEARGYRIDKAILVVALTRAIATHDAEVRRETAEHFIALVDSWPTGSNGQDYRAAVTQCAIAVRSLAARIAHEEASRG